MPLKHIDKANPNLKAHWFELLDQGFIALSLFPKQAASLRTQLGRYRTLSATQAPEFFEAIRWIQLTQYPDPQAADRVIIYGEQAKRIDPAAYQRLMQQQQSPSEPLNYVEARVRAHIAQRRSVAPIPQPAYDPSQHHHNPLTVTHTGIPMVAHEVLPDATPMTEEERRAIAAAEERKRNEELLKSLGFDKPVVRNESPSGE